MASLTPPYEYLYRVLRTDENVTQGLTAKNPTAQFNVETFVENGSYSCRSQYISTSAFYDSAVEWAKKGYNYQDIGRSIAKIDTSRIPEKTATYYDLTNSGIRNREIPNSERTQNFARKYNEVLIVGTIPANAIVSVFNV